MNCDDLSRQIESYLDGELTLSDKRDVEEHLADCNNCENKLAGLRLLQQRVLETEYKNVPSGLKLNIQNQLRDVTGEQSKYSWLLKWLSIGGGAMATGSFATWALMTFIFLSPFNSLEMQLADNIIESHINALLVDHVTDIKNSDRHTVKPWFNGRVDFAPPIKDLSSQGFELIGGRLDYIQGKTSSALVYKRRAHIINAFIFKSVRSDFESEPQLIERQGYNLVYWKNAGLDFWLISDLNKKEMGQLAQLIKKTEG